MQVCIFAGQEDPEIGKDDLFCISLMDEDAHLLTMLYLGDTREDPRHRFDRMEW